LHKDELIRFWGKGEKLKLGASVTKGPMEWCVHHRSVSSSNCVRSYLRVVKSGGSGP